MRIIAILTVVLLLVSCTQMPVQDKEQESDEMPVEKETPTVEKQAEKTEKKTIKEEPVEVEGVEDFETALNTSDIEEDLNLSEFDELTQELNELEQLEI